jgi:hypothetical protein
MTQTSSSLATSARSVTASRKPKRARAGAAGRRKRPDPDSLPVVAWIGEDLEGRGAIVWCRTRGQARQAAAAELDRDFREVESVRRYPALDGFTGNLRRWQLANGWRWECQQCSRPCYGQDEDQELDPSITTVIDKDDQVFCSLDCCKKYEATWALHRATDEAAREEFHRQYPGVELVRVWHNDSAAYAEAGAPLHHHVILWEVVTVRREIWRWYPWSQS